MKTTVNEHTFCNAFKSMRPDDFTSDGLTILFNWLEQIEQDCGEEIELDVIAIACDYVEMTELEIREYYGLEDSDSTTEYLNQHTVVVGTTDTTVLFANF